MIDNEIESVEQPQVAQATAQAQESQGAEEQNQESSSAKPNDTAYNWAEIRKAREEDRKKVLELERRAKEQDEVIKRLTEPKKAVEPDEDDGMADSDLVEGRHVKSLKKEIKQLKSYLKEREASTVDERLQLKFADFTQVVTPENIELLKQTKPVLTNSLRYIPDAYEQGVAAYEMIKEVVMKTEKVAKESLEAKKATENLQKPRSVQSVAKTSSLADVNQFSEMGYKQKQEFLRQKYEEMQQAAKGF